MREIQASQVAHVNPADMPGFTDGTFAGYPIVADDAILEGFAQLRIEIPVELAASLRPAKPVHYFDKGDDDD